MLQFTFFILSHVNPGPRQFDTLILVVVWPMSVPVSVVQCGVSNCAICHVITVSGGSRIALNRVNWKGSHSIVRLKSVRQSIWGKNRLKDENGKCTMRCGSGMRL